MVRTIPVSAAVASAAARIALRSELGRRSIFRSPAPERDGDGCPGDLPPVWSTPAQAVPTQLTVLPRLRGALTKWRHVARCQVACVSVRPSVRAAAAIPYSDLDARSRFVYAESCSTATVKN